MDELHGGRERRRTPTDVRVHGAPAGLQFLERLDTRLPTNVGRDVQRHDTGHRPRRKDDSGEYDAHREPTHSIGTRARSSNHRDRRRDGGRGGCDPVRDSKEETPRKPLRACVSTNASSSESNDIAIGGANGEKFSTRSHLRFLSRTSRCPSCRIVVILVWLPSGALRSPDSWRSTSRDLGVRYSSIRSFLRRSRFSVIPERYG